MVDDVDAAQGDRRSATPRRVERNVALGQKYRVNGTPALVFENGMRKPGALPAAQVEKLLAEAAKKG